MLYTGDMAPDFTLDTFDGETVSLQDTLDSGHKVLLIFLRHLG